MAPEDIAMAAFHPNQGNISSLLPPTGKQSVSKKGSVSSDLKRQIKFLKGDLAVKENELQNLQRNLKFTQINTL